MNMESPVRIRLSFILVVNLLLLSSIPQSDALPLKNGTSETSKEKTKISRFSRFNNTAWTKPTIEDVALNELKPKEAGSSEETDPKGSKYRGRIKFHSYLSSTTETPIKKVIKPTSETPKVIIVTPTPEQKNLSQIIDSMREYKKTKIPPLATSSTTPTIVDLKESSSDEDDTYEDDEEFSKFVSGNFHDSNFFTIPGFSDDEFSRDSKASDNYNKDYSVPPYEKFSSYFPKDMSYSPKREKYESDSYFRDFEDALTTPKNDFFDKKFHEITSSILNNLNSIRAQTPEPNATSVHKIVKENVGLERLLSNGSPNNKSMVIIKNTKEVRLLDDDKGGSAQKELSDVHGTSIYYEMSVLSTETYTIHNDDDCDNDTVPFEPTKSTSFEEEKASLELTAPPLLSLESKPVFVSSTPSPPILTTYIPSTKIPFSDESEFISTYHTTPKVSGFTIRQRGSPKSISFSGRKEASNSVTVKNDELSSNRNTKPVNIRRIQYTTPRSKPVWMAPRRNITRTKPNRPTTIYSEYFNIKDKFNSKTPNRTSVLTTVSSDIDPVFQTDVVGSKKVVHSQSISDNSIPGLRKRGSAKFSTSTTSTLNATTDLDSTKNMEIPPSSAAWALAGMRNPPSLTSPLADRTVSVRKPDENELQNVAEGTEKLETTTIATPIKIDVNTYTEVPSNKIYEVDNNRVPWKPITTQSSVTVESDTTKEFNVSKVKVVPVERNVSFLSTTPIEKTTIGIVTVKETTTASETKDTTTASEWIPATSEEFDQVTTGVKEISNNQIRPLTSSKATAFESITKLPSDLTTPRSDDISPITADSSPRIKHFQNTAAVRSTTSTDVDEVTTMRFSYVPTVTEEITKNTKFTETPPAWHPVLPSHVRTTHVSDDSTITTYRPKYITTTDQVEETTNTPTYPTSTGKEKETTTIIQEISTPQQLVSSTESQITTSSGNISPLTDEIVSATEIITEISVESTPKPEETSTIIVEVVTEINTEREAPTKFAKSTSSTSQETSIEDLSTEAEFITISSSEISEQSSSSKEFMTESNEQKFPEYVHKFTTPFIYETTEESKYDTTTTRRLQTTTMPTIKPTEPLKDHITTTEETTEPMKMETTKPVLKATTENEEYMDTPEEEVTTKMVTNLDDIPGYGEQTTELSLKGNIEAGSGAAVAIAVSTIGVLALVMLVGLLLVVRRRGRRGVYAQRCTPVSLDAYSLDSVSVGLRKGHPRLRASKRSYGNPAYDDEQVTSHPMQYAALANFALDMDSMTTEFSEIPSVTVRPDEVPPGCEDKNRYSNVLPLPETRVPLTRLGNDPTTEYINANYITGPGNIKNYYIACQAPLANTVNDFWRMIWEQNSRLIVMLTEYMENGVEKCFEYLPPSEISDNRRTFGNFQVLLKKREQRDKYAISSVQLTNLSTRTWREVTHLWYFWPAKGVPDDYDSIIDFMSEMRTYMKMSQTAKEYDEDGVEVIYGNEGRSSFGSLGRLKCDDGAGNGVSAYSPQKAEEMMRRANNGTLGRLKAAAENEGVRPCVAVCASGAGRSGALVALDVCARALAAGRVDVPRVVREIRAQRPHALANRHHYIFLYKVLSEYGNKLMGGGVDNI